MNSQLQLILKQAILAFQEGNFDSSDFMLRRVLQVDSKNFQALHILGLIKASQLDYKEAINYLAKAARLFPNDASIHYNLAKALLDSGNEKDALVHHKKTVALNSNNADAWLNYGITLFHLGDYQQAVTMYDRALRLKPNYHEGWSHKGIALCELKRYDEAIAHYDNALSLKPDYAEGWLNKGIALCELKRYEEAITHYNKALSLKPDYAEGWLNKGVALKELKRFDEALAHYDEALSLKPGYAEGWSSKAILDLFLKKYHDGWKNYDWRLKAKDFQLKMAIENLSFWNGSNCKHLLIFSEQGIGDIIFYASMFRSVKNKVSNVTICTDIRLSSILSRSFPDIAFIDSNSPLDESLYDAQIPLGSLPVVMNMTPEMLGRKVPYLVVNDALTTNLNNKYPPKKDLKCGVAWKSSNHKQGKNKSILLSDLNNIFQVEGYEFINLQYGDTQEEIKDFENNFGAKFTTISNIDLFNNLDGLLSIIQTCDFIITTSNVTAHLAGALGKTTFLLVPFSAGRFWYWHEEANSSWYPSISLYSQDLNFEWNGAIKDVALRLKNETLK